MSTVNDLESDVIKAADEMAENLHLFGAQPEPTDGNEPLVVMKPRVFVINFDPIVNVSTGLRLTQQMGWRDINELIPGYIADINECSNGLVQYNVVGRVDVNEFPIMKTPMGVSQFTPDRYQSVLHNPSPADSHVQIDYGRILSDHLLIERVMLGEFDEVWAFGGPYFGFLESTMAGIGAFFCNGEPIPNSPSPRKFVVMGFNYDRSLGVGQMLESLGHRAETTLAQQFRCIDFWNWAYQDGNTRNPKTKELSALNLLERFFCFDQITPGQSNVGTMHYAPNSTTDYQWDLTTPVLSCADDWLQFPNLPNPPHFRAMSTQDWGGGDIRAHHKFWLSHLPKAAGSMRGVRNNWWHYVIDPNNLG